METEEFITVSVRLPVRLHAALVAMAKEERRSLSAEVVIRLEQHPAIAARLAARQAGD